MIILCAAPAYDGEERASGYSYNLLQHPVFRPPPAVFGVLLVGYDDGNVVPMDVSDPAAVATHGDDKPLCNGECGRLPGQDDARAHSERQLVLSGMVPYEDAVSLPAGFEAQNQHWATEIVRAGETITMPVVVLISFHAQPHFNYALACDGLMPQIFAKGDDKATCSSAHYLGIFFTVIAFVIPFITLWDIVSFGILLSFSMSNVALLIVRYRKETPTLAPKLIGGIAASALCDAFFYQQGYVNDDRDWCLVFAIIFLVDAVAFTVTLAVKCTQEPNNPVNFSAPLVPFTPMISILANYTF